MLSAIRSFMQERSTATLAEIALHIGAEFEAARGMVSVWERKGRMAKVPLPCGSCTQCDTAASEIYQWLRESAPLSIAPTPTDCHLEPSYAEPSHEQPSQALGGDRDS